MIIVETHHYNDTQVQKHEQDLRDSCTTVQLYCHIDIDGFINIQKLVQTESLRRRNEPKYQELLAKYGIQ